jgi:hypothetical protein
VTASSQPGGYLTIPKWTGIVVVIGALLMAAGGIIALVNPAMLASPHDQINDAVHVYAGYFACRNLCIAAMLLVLLIMRSRALAQLMLLTAFIQIVDAVLDCMEGRWLIVPGVLILGLLFFVAAARLSRHTFWRAEAWS